MYELSGVGEGIKDFGSSALDYGRDLLFGRRVGRTGVTGVGQVGQDPKAVEAEYQRRLEEFGQAGRGEERFQFERQRQAILGAMQPSDVATQMSRQEAARSAALTTGAARSQGGVSGTQTAALGALGAGQAQQYGYQAAAQVAAQEQQRNALAQAQLAEMLRQQELAQFGLERADVGQMLSSGRALLAPQIEIGRQTALDEARYRNQLIGGTLGGLAAGATQYFRNQGNK